jgi:hypothetical protein
MALALQKNALIGGFTSDVSNLVMLTSLNLSYNQFGGMLPRGLGSLAQLQTLDINHNSFSGGVPLSICNLVNLIELSVCDNDRDNTGCQFITSIPQCVYDAPSPPLSRLNSTAKHVGSIVSVSESAAAKKQDAVTIAVLSVLLCIAYLGLIYYLYITYGKKDGDAAPGPDRFAVNGYDDDEVVGQKGNGYDDDYVPVVRQQRAGPIPLASNDFDNDEDEGSNPLHGAGRV